MKPTKTTYIFLILGITLLGLASRKYANANSWIYLYVGDALWAMLFYFVFRVLFTQKTLLLSTIIAFLWSYLIEFSQLYHAPFIDKVRATTFGKLLLGSGFLWSDLLSYGVGILVGVSIDAFFFKANR